MKRIFGLAVTVLGFFVGVAGLSFAGKPSNVSISLDPIDAISTYFFSFAWVGGVLGTIIGAALLAVYLALWYFIGVRIYLALRKSQVPGEGAKRIAADRKPHSRPRSE